MVTDQDFSFRETPVTTAPTPRIAVIGGGPGGLTLARVLRTLGIPSTVLERDASPTARPQGGTLDLHPDSGLAAIRTARLDDRFRELSRPEGEEAHLTGADGAALFSHTPEPGTSARPEIDRGDLRDLLLGSLAPGTVQWGSTVTSVRPAGQDSSPGAHTLTFADGSTRTFDLVVGADGAWSRTRALLSEAVPVFSGVHFVETRITDAVERHPDIARTVGHGSLYAFEDERAVMSQRNSSGAIRTYFTVRAPEKWAQDEGIDFGDPDAARAALRSTFHGWAPQLLALLEHCDDTFQHRPMYALPTGHTWDSRPGITLLGDAAHLMTPFAGLGANLAMLDAAELALAIAESDDLGPAVSNYEQRMLHRSAEAAALTEHGLAACISPDAPHSALAYLESVA